jgi:ssDNA-binding Zn-finger/Zn-ribbon topoisomerase 1
MTHDLPPNWTGRGALSEPIVCPTCREGVVVDRQSQYGKFWGCSRYPVCLMKITNAHDLNQLVDPDYDEPYYGM